MAERPHGYARYKLDGCRCYTCAYAVSVYSEDRRKQIAAGTWQPFINFTDNTAVRDHIEAHARAGVGTRQLALLSGVDRKVIQCVRSGSRKGRPLGRMRRDLAEKILAVPVSADTAAAHAVVSATGARRRIQALCAIGWGFRAQAELAGWPRDRWHRINREERILAATAQLVRDVYRQLSMTPAPTGYASTRIRKVAARDGWFPPLAWDDECLDDPAATPCVVPAVADSDPRADELAVQHAAAGHAVELDPITRVELVRRLTDANYTTEQIATLAQTTVHNVGRIRSDYKIRARRAA